MSKIVLITGSNRGIGREVARQLLQKGHTVIGGVREMNAVDFRELETLSGEFHKIKLDVNLLRDATTVSEYIDTRFGKLDVLINNAATLPNSNSLSRVTEEEMETTLNTNVLGVFRTSQTLAPLLLKSKSGRIINVSSGMGSLNELYGDHAAYRLSKVSLNALTRMFANEYPGLQVVSVCPGWVRTDMGGSSAPRSVGKGAEGIVSLTLSDQIESGKFYRDSKIIPW